MGMNTNILVIVSEVREQTCDQVGKSVFKIRKTDFELTVPRNRIFIPGSGYLTHIFLFYILHLNKFLIT